MRAEQFLCDEENKTGLARTSRWTWESACQFAEAFRDKSESPLRDEIARIASLDGRREIAGLREEIERLKAELSLVDEALARRPALAHIDYRYNKIFAACAQAAQYDREHKLREAAEAELAALRERERWIPVSERWPQANEFVHVVIGGIFQMVPARLIDDRWYWFIEEADTAPKEAVTHWKALSAAPEVKS